MLVSQCGRGAGSGGAGGANSVPRAELGKWLPFNALRSVLESRAVGELSPGPQKGMSGRVEVAGTAILYLAIMEPTRERMLKMAAKLHREHKKRFHAKPRKVIWGQKWG